MIHAGIIAAGLGERLKGAGVPKPLVPVAGRPLVHWTVSALAASGAGSITMLLNTRGREVRASLEAAFPRLEWRFLEWDSPTSWTSFRRVSQELAGVADRFVISTVDALMRPSDVATFTRRALESKADAALAVTPFIEDEKPLWADLDASSRIVAVGDDARARRWLTCGLYGLTASCARASAGREHGRLRDFWTELVRSGAQVDGVVFEKTIDVDRPEDLRSAEKFVKEALCH